MPMHSRDTTSLSNTRKEPHSIWSTPSREPHCPPEYMPGLQDSVFRTDLTEESKTRNSRLTENTESHIHEETNTDEHLSKLITTILQGWPDDRNYVPQTIQAYWNYQDELTTQNDLSIEVHKWWSHNPCKQRCCTKSMPITLVLSQISAWHEKFYFGPGWDSHHAMFIRITKALRLCMSSCAYSKCKHPCGYACASAYLTSVNQAFLVLRDLIMTLHHGRLNIIIFLISSHYTFNK